MKYFDSTISHRFRRNHLLEAIVIRKVFQSFINIDTKSIISAKNNSQLLWTNFNLSFISILSFIYIRLIELNQFLWSHASHDSSYLKVMRYNESLIQEILTQFHIIAFFCFWCHHSCLTRRIKSGLNENILYSIFDLYMFFGFRSDSTLISCLSNTFCI